MPLSDRPVTFRILIPMDELASRGCDHSPANMETLQRWAPTCRPCSVTLGIHEAGAVFSWGNDLVGETRILTGVADTEAQKMALARLIAFAYGHPEPTPPEKMQSGLVIVDDCWYGHIRPNEAAGA